MPVKSIYTKYFQKSKVFLYPLLGIKRGRGYEAGMFIPSNK